MYKIIAGLLLGWFIAFTLDRLNLPLSQYNARLIASGVASFIMIVAFLAWALVVNSVWEERAKTVAIAFLTTTLALDALAYCACAPDVAHMIPGAQSSFGNQFCFICVITIVLPLIMNTLGEEDSKDNLSLLSLLKFVAAVSILVAMVSPYIKQLFLLQ